ncbi:MULTISPECIES: helix-turn-helix domain-containing protein [Rhizobium]|uniref:helix-turn-helix domain-containing protein n=1 Tax=Rhizobium TaxID=379 RepID=UPI0018041B97|nr:LysR family transcriptional regulator [Rhizobium leguminosarum]MBB4510494.1 DNA-binding transcriptional LysR family regulator [Rhizobium leguminosarum]
MAQHPQLNLRHLEAIVTAGRLGSISSASEAINLSQPALTQAVGRVEAQLGHLLFDRQPSGVTPTEAGRLITARIERALAYVARGGQACDVERACPRSLISNDASLLDSCGH